MFMSEKGHDFANAAQSPVITPSLGKTRIMLRVDTDTIDWFRWQVHDTGGGNYQTLINEALRDHVRQQGDGLEDTLRKVIREELHAASG